ncbi:MAG: 3-deoxy-D-manno-octulosonic acid transferase [Chlorobiales bacterium]|nr:3-deoxy-D-manno-octulosonic acid transferase [Chlorobiales bacterium]
MHSFPLFFYTLFVPFIFGAAKLFSPLHPKLRIFFEVRKGVFDKLKQQINSLQPGTTRVWIHAASVGEFEQARPIIAALKEKRPDITVFVSFFSDSGYNARKKFPDAFAVFYLPADTEANAKKIVSLLKPDILLLMRYDFWPNHLLEAKKYGTKLILAAAVLQKNAPYFKPVVKSFYRSIFHLFDQIYTVAANDTEAFTQIFMCGQTETAGDPRFDQVVMRSKNAAKVDYLKPFFKDNTVLVAGSVWEKDVTILLAAWQQLDKRPSLILVPHEVSDEKMASLYRDLQNRSLAFMKVSSMNDKFDPEKEILVIDQTGYLMELYSLASFAYVGGGFGINVHNTLEPAVYGIPVLFGPRHHNSPEAEDLVTAGGAIVIHDETTLSTTLKTLTTDTIKRIQTGQLAEAFVTERTGASAKVVKSIDALLRELPRFP